jgi:hypothetical protein
MFKVAPVKLKQKFERNSLLDSDTFKSCDLIGYKESRRDLSEYFQTTTLLP